MGQMIITAISPRGVAAIKKHNEERKKLGLSDEIALASIRRLFSFEHEEPNKKVILKYSNHIFKDKVRDIIKMVRKIMKENGAQKKDYEIEVLDE